MAFDGVNFNGYSLKIRRPKDYQPLPGQQNDTSPYIPGVISTNVPDTPNKIFIGGLPPYFTEDQVKQLLQVFGELRAFNLVKDTSTGNSKGFAFCEFLDPNITDIACQGLNGMDVSHLLTQFIFFFPLPQTPNFASSAFFFQCRKVGEKKLIVQRASVGAKSAQIAPIQPMMTSGVPLLPVGVIAGPNEATTILQLLNMVTESELVDDDEYDDIVADIKDECEKYGAVKSVFIPRPFEGVEVRGLGKVGRLFSFFLGFFLLSLTFLFSNFQFFFFPLFYL
jgi:splicing factor U2AF subunit